MLISSFARYCACDDHQYLASVFLGYIYFYEGNTKYISWSVIKNSIVQKCAAQVKILIFFTTGDEMYWYVSNEVNVLLFSHPRINCTEQWLTFNGRSTSN